jgi:hypothetical protein
VGNEHGIRHGTPRPDTAADAVVPLALVVTVTHVIAALTHMVALVMHVCHARLCGVLRGRHPGPGTPGLVSGVGGNPACGHTSSAFDPALGP